MTQLTPLQLDDGSLIYLEVTQGTEMPVVFQEHAIQGEEEVLVERGMNPLDQTSIVGSSRAIENTIRAYTSYTLNAFKQIAIANVDKVTLKFGIRMSGEAGIPYITKGSAEGNLEISVECSFPK
ncbi:MAG: hypothetical protein IGS48_09165 [Oscillatoriales cyanobacterium C42_A2020_001]|nr:hypothetical protein [Leptolyngbyaceae cyanobacterium C42_A2020_001]